jgi:hypothetical protein
MVVCGQHYAPVALPPKKSPVPIEYEARWAPEPVWALWTKVPCSFRDLNHKGQKMLGYPIDQEKKDEEVKEKMMGRGGGKSKLGKRKEEIQRKVGD